jgi:hypothetical protein
VLDQRWFECARSTAFDLSNRLATEYTTRRLAGLTSIATAHPPTSDATELIAELGTHLEPLYSSEREGTGQRQTLIADDVASLANSRPGACGGMRLSGTEYRDIKRMDVEVASAVVSRCLYSTTDDQKRGPGWGRVFIVVPERFTRTPAAFLG